MGSIRAHTQNKMEGFGGSWSVGIPVQAANQPLAQIGVLRRFFLHFGDQVEHVLHVVGDLGLNPFCLRQQRH